MLGNLGYAASQFGVLVVTARFGSTLEVGRLALAFAVVGPVFAFLELNLRAVIATDVGSRYSFAQYMASRVLTIPIGIAVSAGIGLLVASDREMFLVVLTLSVAKAAGGVSTAYHGIFARCEELGWIAVSTCLRGSLQLVAFGSVYSLTGDLSLSVLMMTLGAVATVVGYDRVRRVRLGIPGGVEIEAGTLRRIYQMSLPLGIASSAHALGGAVPRILLEIVRGTAELGLFAPIADATRLLRMTGASIHQAVLPRLATLRHAGNSTSRIVLRSHLAAAAINAVALITTVLVGNAFVRSLLGPPYADMGLILVMVLAAALAVHVTVQLALVVAHQEFIKLLMVRLVALATTSIAGLVLIPRLGTLGAGMSMAVGSMSALTFAGRRLRLSMSKH